MSKDMVFNYPVEFEIKVMVINDETGQNGFASFSLGKFEHPSPEKVKEKLSSVISELNAQGVTGFRLATKREAWDAVCIERTGQTFAMPKGEEWEEPTP